MTRFKERLQSEQVILEQWLKRYSFKSVLDAACGTGLHSILFKKLGLRVVGADVSTEMLKYATQNAHDQNVQVDWIAAPMQELNAYLQQPFEAIFCLGNSLPHLLSIPELYQTLQTFFKLLNPGGRLVLQLLNYSKIVREKERIIQISRSGEKQFIRFYDFLKPRIRFNLLIINWPDQKPVYQLISTELYPYTKIQIEKELKKMGFKNLEFFSDMRFETYDPKNSTNLIVVAQRPPI